MSKRNSYVKTTVWNGEKMSQALLGVLSHPLRRLILRTMDKSNTPMSPVELAREFRVDLSSVSYHVTILKKAGVIQLKETQPKRGATEHRYVSAIGRNEQVREILAAIEREDRTYVPSSSKYIPRGR